MATRQDPDVKGNPWLLRYDLATATWAAPSASGGPDRIVDLAAAAEGDWAAGCSCPCQRRCWHIAAAELREQLDAVGITCDAYYADWSLAALQAEDVRLALLFASEGGGPFLRRQYQAIGDAIAARLDAAAAA